MIILTALARDAEIERAFGAGAHACLHKDAELPEILASIRSARSGGARTVDRPESGQARRIAEEPLTRRETEVLDHIARGWSNHRVAEALGIGAGTVKTHLKRVYGKLYARNRTEAAVIARRKGLL